MIPLIVKKAFSPRLPYVKIEIDFSAWPRLLYVNSRGLVFSALLHNN